MSIRSVNSPRALRTHLSAKQLPLSLPKTLFSLVIGAPHDTMDPAHMEMMAGRLPRGRYLHCADGSHLAMYDDQEAYFSGLIDFLHGIAGR